MGENGESLNHTINKNNFHQAGVDGGMNRVEVRFLKTTILYGRIGYGGIDHSFKAKAKLL